VVVNTMMIASTMRASAMAVSADISRLSVKLLESAVAVPLVDPGSTTALASGLVVSLV
jgi:hypothetical protein